MNVYDFDNTIYSGDSQTKFYFYCLRKKPSLIRFIFVWAFYSLLRLIHVVSIKIAKEKSFSFYFSLSKEERQTFIDGFWQVNRKNIKGWYLEQKKDTDFVFSSTPKVIIEPIAKELGFKLIATEIDEENKKFLTEIYRGDAKFRRLREETNEPIEEFYSASNSDVCLAREAKKAFFVSGNYVLNWDSAQLSQIKRAEKPSLKAKTILKKVGISFGILIVSSVILFSLLIASYALPTSAMQAHRNESLETIKEQGQYFNIFNTTIDNYTDRNFIDVATYQSNEGLLERAFRNSGEKTSYIRYVSGFLVVLKPLMLVMNITGIRILNAVLHVIIIVALIFLFIKKKLILTMLAFLATYIFMSPVSMAYTLAYNPDFYVTTITLILMLVLDKWLTKHNFYPYFFILIGIFISFFDLLMFTLVAFGLPLVLYFNLHPPKSISDGIKKLVISGICWVFGYASIILIKEIIASIVTGENVLNLLKEVIINRSGSDVWGANYGRMEGIIRNVKTSVGTTHLFAVNFGLFCVGYKLFMSENKGVKKYVHLGITLSCFFAESLLMLFSMLGKISNWYQFILLLFDLVYLGFVTIKFKPFDKTLFLRLFWTFFVIAIIPFVWYFVFLNHSIIHYWYSFRLISISIFAVISAFFIYISTVERQLPYYRHSKAQLN